MASEIVHRQREHDKQHKPSRKQYAHLESDGTVKIAHYNGTWPDDSETKHRSHTKSHGDNVYITIEKDNGEVIWYTIDRFTRAIRKSQAICNIAGSFSVNGSAFYCRRPRSAHVSRIDARTCAVTGVDLGIDTAMVTSYSVSVDVVDTNMAVATYADTRVHEIMSGRAVRTFNDDLKLGWQNAAWGYQNSSRPWKMYDLRDARATAVRTTGLPDGGYFYGFTIGAAEHLLDLEIVIRDEHNGGWHDQRSYYTGMLDIRNMSVFLTGDVRIRHAPTTVWL